MVTFSRVPVEEIERWGTGKGRGRQPVDLSEYTDYLRDLTDDDWAMVQVDESENKRTIKRRLTSAAKLLGRAVKYRTTLKVGDTESLYFKVYTPEENSNSRSQNGTTEAPKRRGRKPKVSPETVENKMPSGRTKTKRTRRSKVAA